MILRLFDLLHKFNLTMSERTPNSSLAAPKRHGRGLRHSAMSICLRVHAFSAYIPSTKLSPLQTHRRLPTCPTQWRRLATEQAT